MCCLVAVLAFLGPRAGILVWWLLDPTRWERAFDGFVVPLFGSLILPWTTMAWVLVAPDQRLVGIDWAWMAAGVLADLILWSGSTRRRRFDAYGW